MVKVFQVLGSSDFGGGERIAFDLTKGLKARFQFVILAPPGFFERKYKQEKVEVKTLTRRGGLRNVLAVRRFLAGKEPAILHAHGTRASFWARLAVVGLSNKPKIIYTLHGFHLPRRGFLSRWFLLALERCLNKLTDVLVCVSESDKNLVLKYRTISSKKIRVIKNGIDIKKFQISQDQIQQTKKELGLKDSFVLCSIGRLHPPKDFSTILKALKLIVARVQNVKLLIVGDGPLREPLEREARALGLNAHVEFLGFREDIPALINLSDIVVLSTHWEGLPLVPLEVGASKKPIIASNVDGVREAIINGKTGFLFKPGSAKDLAGKILKLFRSKGLRAKVGERGFEFISKNFSQEKMAGKYQRLYLSLL